MAQPRLPTQRQMQDAKVSPSAISTLFHTLDRDHDGYVCLPDLDAFASKHHVAFEMTEYAVDDELAQLPPSVPEQTAQTLSNMFYEALSLRAPTIFAKSAGNGEGLLTIKDLATALQIRRQKIQTSSGSTDHKVVYSSQFRSQWLDLLLRIVPQPFEPLSPDRPSTGKKGPILVQSMLEREAAHEKALRTARLQERAEAPIGPGSEYNRSTTLHHPPMAISPAASYEFTKPQVRTTRLSERHLQSKQAQLDRATAKADQLVGARQRKLKNIARALDARDAAERHQQQQQEESKSPSGFASDDGSDLGLDGSWQRGAPSAGGASNHDGLDQDAAIAAGEQLHADHLSFVSFRTREEFAAELAAERLQSESLDYKPGGSASLQVKGNGDDEEEEDLLAKTLLAMSTGSNHSNKKPFHSSRLQGAPTSPTAAASGYETPQQRVARLLAAQKQSHSTSGKFKPLSVASIARNGQPLPEPRWINPNDASVKVSEHRRPKTAEVQYDDQGKPIRTVRRQALTARLIQHPGVVSYEQQRKDWDASQASLLSQATERAMQSFLIPDPLESILAPFVPQTQQQRPTEALDRALKEVPSTAKTTSPKKSSRGIPLQPESNGLGTAHTDWSRSSTSDAKERDKFTGKQPFQLHFHLASPQDERLHSATSLSVFRHDRSNPPTISNGGITQLSQLRPGGFSASNTANAAAIFNRDASAGDISLLPQGSFALSTILAREKLDRSRPSFRLDFVKHLEHDAKHQHVPSDIISRDGGLTTAEQSEKWRAAQLGWHLQTKSGKAKELAEAEERHQHTRGKIVRTDHLAPGAHNPSHSSDFSTLLKGRSPLENPKFTFTRLEQSEREAYLKMMGQLPKQSKQQTKDPQQAAEKTYSRLKPSERRQLHMEEEKKKQRQQFPFRSLYELTPSGHATHSDTMAKTTRW